MTRVETSLPGVYIIEPTVFADARGFFYESYHQQKYAELGITNMFVQDNHSLSRGNTLRGLHYQLRQPQAKLCRVVAGEVLDVAVDIRRGSPTFGKWVAVRLSAENKRQVYIPAGFAHGFLVLSETAEVLYRCDAFYAPNDDYGIAWNDPAIGVEWPLMEPPIMSARDQQHPGLRDVDPELLPVYRPAGEDPAAAGQVQDP